MNRCSPSRKFIGVDAVEFKKARAFYKTHQNRLNSFFNSSEIRLIERDRKPYESLAMVLAAKEAVFKASENSWMGPAGFRKIQIISRKRDRLSFRLKGNFKKSFSRRPLPCLSISKKKDMIIVQCCSAG